MFLYIIEEIVYFNLILIGITIFFWSKKLLINIWYYLSLLHSFFYLNIYKKYLSQNLET